jgi:hypothetical protein
LHKLKKKRSEKENIKTPAVQTPTGASKAKGKKGSKACSSPLQCHDRNAATFLLETKLKGTG